jgi:hypothetical protein
MRHEAGNMQRTTNDMQRATGNMRQTSRNMQRTTTSCNATCSMQRATCHMQHAHATDHVKFWKRPLTTGTKATRQQGNMRHAAGTTQKTANPCNACNRQRATDSRRNARGREHMRAATRKHTALPHFLCGEQGGSGQPSSVREALFSTTSAQHGTDATHKMQHTTGAAACSKHTRNRHHAAGKAMHDETKESGRSRTSRRGLSVPETAPKAGRQQVPSRTWRCLPRSSPTLTHIVGMRASLAN